MDKVLKEPRASYKIRPFKHLNNCFWVGWMPYEVKGKEYIPLAGLADKKCIDKLKKYLSENSNTD